VNSADALRIGLADQVLPGPRPSFEDMVLAHARRLAGHDDYYRLLERKRADRAADERRRPLDVYRTEELAAMSRDIFDDRLGFAAARHAFVMKRPADTQRTDTRTGAQRIVA
jgi:putative two-component system hydrogenase maturation factor HypX/HoxX